MRIQPLQADFAAIGAIVGVSLAAAIFAVNGPARAQTLPPPPTPAMPKDLPMHSILFDADAFARANRQLSAGELATALEQRGLAVLEGRVHVEIVGPEGEDAAVIGTLLPFGGRIDQTHRNRIDAWLPPDRLREFAATLPPGWIVGRVNAPQPDAVAGEGPGVSVINSGGYRDGGANGTGLTIAVIDGGYSGLTAAKNNGDAPLDANTAKVDYATGNFEDGGTHGTGCLEAAFDHCPGATWRLYKVDSTVDLGVVADDAIANGVDVVTHSLSWFNLGWEDGTGAACQAADEMSAAGIFFFTSAGNYAQDHWQGFYAAGSGSPSWHDWSNGDEALSMTIPANTTARWRMAWNTGGGTFDYDIYLYDSTLSTILVSGVNGGNTYEDISWMNTSGSPVTVHLAVLRYSGGVTEFEIFGDGNSTGWEYQVAAGSTTSPSNATGAHVFAIGAVPWGSYAQPSGSNPIASYSSRGPSNSGRILPDLVGPTDTTGFTYPAGFGGTSCATPNTAGAVCAFWSDQPQFATYAINWLIVNQAYHLWRDWGAGGADHVYGYGPCRLVDFHPSTTWVSRVYGNTTEQTFGPYYSVAVGENAAAWGGRLLLFLAGNYPENLTLDKALTVQSAGGTSFVGQ